MKYYGQKNIPERLSHAEEILVTVAVDEVLKNRLAVAGYTDIRFNEVHQLLVSAQRLETNQQVQMGKQTSATSALKDRTRTVRLKFVSDRRMIRHALRGDKSLSEELRLHIRTKESREALIRQMTHFYEEVVKQETLMMTLETEFNLTAALFSHRMQGVEALAQAMQAQQYQIGLVREATRERQEAMKELDAWMRAFIGMTRQVFRDEEANLRKLNVYVKSAPSPKEEEGDIEVIAEPAD